MTTSEPTPLPLPLAPDALGKIAIDAYRAASDSHQFSGNDCFREAAVAVARAVLASLAVGALPALHKKHGISIDMAEWLIETCVQPIPELTQVLLACDARRLAAEASLKFYVAENEQLRIAGNKDYEGMRNMQGKYIKADHERIALESEVARLAGELKELRASNRDMGIERDLIN